MLRDMGKDWEIIELDLDPPREGEVLIRFAAAGLCHSDDHLRTGDIPVRYPIVGGHEGAGIVEEVGIGVSRLKPGDHVVCSFLPTCGHCRFCASGMTNLCDMGALFVDNCLPDGTFRFHADGEDFGQMCLLGTFSQRSVVSEHSCVKIDDDLPLETVALVGCGVPTGWGTAVNAGAVRPGDTTVIYGIGGVGINAVQGAAFAGARNVIAVDPLEFKRENAMEFGATHVAASAEEAASLVSSVTRGVGADQALITVGVVTEEVISAAFAGARNVIAVDPLEFKRENAMEFGATHVAASAEAAQELVTELTRGVGADQALITVGVVTEDVIAAAFAAVRKRGTVVITGLAGPGKKTIQLPSFELTLFEKRLQGALFGSGNPFDTIPKLLELYQAGQLKLDELVTNRYTLDEVNQGYRDMLDGRNIRGLLIHES